MARGGLTYLHRFDRHQNEIDCVVPVSISQSPRDWDLSVPPSSIVITTQAAKMSFVKLSERHPRMISGYGFCMTGRKGLALTGRQNGKNEQSTHDELSRPTFP